FYQENVSAYLCGDRHKVDGSRYEKKIELRQNVNSKESRSIPNIIGYKGVVDNNDNYSDFGLIWHLWNEETDEVSLEHYKWTKKDQAAMTPETDINFVYELVRKKDGSGGKEEQKKKLEEDKPPPVGYTVNNLDDRNVYFAGREDILSEISHGLEKASTAILVGQGGFGKTQTAVEYAHRHLTDYEYIWIFNAESESRLEDEYRKFAIRVMGRETARTEEFEVVWAYIENWFSMNKSYLFIYDNAENCPKLSDFLPHGVRGHIVINTRERLKRILGTYIDITVFSPEDAVVFLEKRIEGADKTEAEALSKELGHLPLALEQAGAFIIESKKTIADYIKLLKDYGLRILDTEPLDMDYGRTVLTTWKISFDKIEQDKNAEASICLFKLLAYCAPDDIPLRMFISGRDKLPSPLAVTLEPSNALGHIKLTNRLTRYSLVAARDDGKGSTLLSVHRLMQAVVKHDLGNNTEYMQCCLDMAESVFHYEYGTREDFDSFTLCLPHMVEIVLCSELCLEDDNEAIIKAGRIFREAGRGLDKKGEYAEALEWYNKALAIKEKMLGEEHPDTIRTRNNIANVNKAMGK
ncbi:MAG: tetratricopeptide repeat protein, partial [Oscillospiraceae bacterium]|nr:tetratricopeptide repeat protein [Oscillospiraceae bacterium]